jgi:hypothetical protein
MAFKSSYKPKSIIKKREAKKMFVILIKKLEKEGIPDDRTILIIDNMILLELLKQDRFQDIKERGVIELFKNGSQEIFRENKSVDKILKILERQRKLLSELFLTPSSAKRVAEVGEWMSLNISNLKTTRHAMDVVAGKIIASKKVRLACERHLKDLEKQGTDKFSCIFDEEKAYRPIAFIEKFCKPSKENDRKLGL